ncbi:MAG: OadG family protein [Oscillospiraceae bacterium]
MPTTSTLVSTLAANLNISADNLTMLVIAALGAVFVILILCIAFFARTGKILGILNAPKPTPAGGSSAFPFPVSNGIDEETVAAITAAILAYEAESGKTVTIKGIRRSREQRPVWAAQGLAENTRPF